ncbi:gp53-like domain-containing protein [Megasphaera sp.]|uniref:gp53-like domain-containing protein n=1 Tax=Megasphaera sp. TaxID=2023260 RepID=UPI003F7FCA35
MFTASTSAGTGHVNFPLAYSAACYSLALSTNDSGATIYRCTPSGINTTGFYYVMTSTEAKEARYICIGK